jgi:hypothetical protein
MPTLELSSFALRHPRLVAQHALVEAVAAKGAPWTDFLRRLPLTLGESDLDRTVPYSFSDGVEHTLQRAGAQLLDLLRRRAEPEYDREKQSALLPDERQRVVLWPRRSCPRSLPTDGPWRPLVRLALLRSPDLDAGLLESWLSRQAGGRELVEQLTQIFTRALRLGREHPDASGVGLMVHLAGLQTLLRLKEIAKQVQVRGLPYARLERAVGMVLYATFRQASEDALAGQGGLPTGGPERRDLEVVLACLSPLWFVAVRQGERDDLNPYGLSQVAEELLAPVYSAALERDNRPINLAREILRALSAQPPLQAALAQRAACEGLRRRVLDHLLAREDPAREADRRLAEAFRSDETLLAILEQPSVLSGLAADLAERAASLPRGEPRQPLERLQAMLTRARDQGPPWLRPSPEDALDLQELIERFLLQRMDEFVHAQLSPVLLRLVDRRGLSSGGALRLEYETGRLYRLACDDLPMLRRRVAHLEGQLFVDLKGYTRRTARAKELVMAEFLQREFYEPILEAAARYRTGADLVSREQNIQLVNLLGDAVAFSGNIVSLVGLARDIQGIFRTYRRRLQELAPESDARALGAASQRFEAARAELAVERAKLSAELQRSKREVFRRSGLDPEAMVAQLREDFDERFARVQQTYRSLQAREQLLADASKRAELATRLEGIRQAHGRLKDHKAQMLDSLKSLRGDELASKLGDYLCQGLLERVRELEGRLRAIDEEERALEDALEEERQRHGAGLEAGLFISHGAAAEVLQLSDDVWGVQRVAVSERINEAARGTARNAQVKRRFDELLAEARAARGQPGLELPFGVLICQTRSGGLPPRLLRLWQAAEAEGDPARRTRLAEELARSLQQELSGGAPEPAEGAGGGADIYNLGEAMSAAALDAYIRQCRGTHSFYRIQVRPTELGPEVLARFFFPDEVLTLVLGVPVRTGPVLGTEVEVFRYVGQVLFRGFEVTQPTYVYEILRPDSPFVRLLAKHSLERWVEALRPQPDRRLEGLPELGSEAAQE